MNALVLVVSIAIGLWLLSFAVEALRHAPESPRRLRWAPDVAIDHVTVNGHRLRYIRAGRGPNLLLLHTLRTQLDLFEKVVSDLSRDFTVYALDYPGHGYSDIPEARYDADFFAGAVEGFLERLDLRDVTLVGVSIGGAIALILAGRRNPRTARVIAINPYDYARGLGIGRSSLLGWMIAMSSQIPAIGETVMRLRNFLIIRSVLNGGVANPASIPPVLLREMNDVGNRHRHYRAFISLLRNAASWEVATNVYQDIQVPVRLVWGEGDWSRPAERAREHRLIPRAEVISIENGGHFLPLDRPDAVVEQIRLSA